MFIYIYIYIYSLPCLEISICYSHTGVWDVSEYIYIRNIYICIYTKTRTHMHNKMLLCKTVKASNRGARHFFHRRELQMIYTYTHKCVFIYKYIHIYMNTYIYIYTHTHTHIHTKLLLCRTVKASNTRARRLFNCEALEMHIPSPIRWWILFSKISDK